VLVALGAAAVSWAGEPDEDDARPAAKQNSWFGGWFGSKPKPAATPAKGDKAKSDKTDAKGKDATARGAAVVDTAAAVRAREEAAYLRRLEVCDRIREIAESTNDEKLYSLATELSQRVWDVYTQRTAHLPSGRGDLDLDEQLLEKNLSPGGAAGSRPPSPLTHAATGKGGNSRAAAREEQP
jgi:hypothetical protein